jgi:ankyrin repeat protein
VNLKFADTTPLHLAIAASRVELVECFLQNGANPAALGISTDKNTNENCLQKAIKAKNLELIDLILKYDNNHELVNKTLIQSIYEQDLYAVQILISKGANVNNTEDLPLCVAAYRDKEAIICSELLKAGADVNIVDEWGNTPLAQAVWVGNVELVKLLVGAGSDVNFITKNGISIWFCYSNKHEISKIIVESGTLDLSVLDVNDTKQYENIRKMIVFEKQAIKDIANIKAACAASNCDNITDNYISQKDVNAMSEYYGEHYQKKFAELMQADFKGYSEKDFFDELANSVMKILHTYVKYNWHQILGIAKTFSPSLSFEQDISDTSGDEVVLPTVFLDEDVIGLLGEYIDCHIIVEVE